MYVNVGGGMVVFISMCVKIVVVNCTTMSEQLQSTYEIVERDTIDDHNTYTRPPTVLARHRH